MVSLSLEVAKHATGYFGSANNYLLIDNIPWGHLMPVGGVIIRPDDQNWSITVRRKKREGENDK